MNPNLNVIKLLIIANFIVFTVALSVIYFRYSTTKQEITKTTQQLDSSTQTTIVNISSGEISTVLQLAPATTMFADQEVAIKPLKLQLRKPKFVYFSSKAKKVELIGDFNDWIPQKMKKVTSNRWELTIEIPEGKYLYNFLVDGKIMLDPNNKRPPELSSQGFKSSVLELK